MDARYLMFIVLIIITGCDDPAKNLRNFTPSSLEYVFSEGGVYYANNESIDFSDDRLSKKTDTKYIIKKGDENYLSILSFLNKYNKPIGLFRNVTIPSRHVILLYIKYENKKGNDVNLSLGENWISYSVHVDSFGESSNTVYPAEKKEILNLLKTITTNKKQELVN